MGFTIKELESLTGVKAHTIRIWEQRYRFLKPSRTSTNIRTYNNEELKTLLNVALLNKYGYKISRIDEMAAEQRSQEIVSLQYDEAQNENLVNELIGCMIDLDIQQFERIINQSISTKGIEVTITTIIFAFLEKIGILWQAGRVNPAHEHIVSNIIRQKIIAAIEAVPAPDYTKPLFLLFLPEGEYHELGLLFVYYLMRRKDLPVIYLGANVPLKDVQYVTDLKKPQHLYVHLTAMPTRHNFPKFIASLSTKNPEAQLVLSGQIANDAKMKVGENVTLLQSLAAVSSYITTL
ncbi:MAG: MerR family transcriptional regulator [Flaviaesturariibacter sp.]|nr:MerR family transcriptional regulator [Flaviaesturariibacter sp.]